MKRILTLILAFTAALCITAQTAVDNFLATPELQHANVSLMVKDLTTNKVVAKYRADAITPPASVMKIVTTATALEMFGASYRYKTRIETSGEIDSQGTLHGNLYIVGAGDPTMGSKYLGGQGFITSWVKKIREKGISRIAGDVIADISRFDCENINPFWIWEDIGNYYAPGVFAIAYYDNTISIALAAHGENQPVTVESVTPEIDSLMFVNALTCTSQIPTTDIYVRGLPLNNTRYLSGNISVNAETMSISGDIPNPALLLASDFTKALRKAGIGVAGEATFSHIRDTTERQLLFIHTSPTLADIAQLTNFKSNNMYAEHIFRLIGTRGVEMSTRQNAVNAIINYWRTRVPAMQWNNICDGSGLSPVDRLSAESLVDLLAYMTNSKNYQSFYNSLPVAGYEGTVRSFLNETPLQGKAHVKSGTTSRIKSYAGYAEGPSGHKYAFAVIVADPAARVRKVQPLMEKLLVSICQ